MVAVGMKTWGTNAPIIIGLTIVLLHFVVVSFTGASVNPARFIGSALVSAEQTDFWIHLVGPAIGATAVAIGWLFRKDFGEESLEG